MTENFIYTITEGQNDILCWSDNGTEYIYEVPQDNYNVDTLVTLLNTVLSPYNVTLAYDLDLRKLVITKTGVNTFFFIDPASIRTVTVGDLVKRGNRFLYMLGLYQNARTGTELSGTTYGEDPVNLNRTGVLFINIYNNISVLHSDVRNPQSITSVPVDVGYGEKIVYLPPSPPTFVLQPNMLESLGIYVTDEWGEEVKVPENTGLMIHLVLYQIKS